MKEENEEERIINPFYQDLGHELLPTVLIILTFQGRKGIVSAIILHFEINIIFSSYKCLSVSSSKRKNKDRSIGSVDDDSIEYGAPEAGKMYDGEQGTKRLEEGSKKLPE